MLRYVISDKDRHGNLRYYVRAPGRKKHRLRATPGTDDFIREYQDAMAGVDKKAPAAVKPGSFRHLCVRYYGSKKFRSLDVSTQNWQRRSLDGICIARLNSGPVIGPFPSLVWKAVTSDPFEMRRKIRQQPPTCA
jgi:integrase/recombinase XerD